MGIGFAPFLLLLGVLGLSRAAYSPPPLAPRAGIPHAWSHGAVCPQVRPPTSHADSRTFARSKQARDVRARNVRARVNAYPHPHACRRASIASADVTRCGTRPARGAGARASAPLRALTLSARSADGADVRGSALSARARVRGASTTSAPDMDFGAAVLPGANPQKSVFNKLESIM
jgi:hypothetical protein